MCTGRFVWKGESLVMDCEEFPLIDCQLTFRITWKKTLLLITGTKKFNKSSIDIKGTQQWCLTRILFTFALNSARKSKCFLRSVARMASMTRKRKRLNSTCSRLTRKLYSGRDMKRFHAEAAWWFSKTERSLYRRAYSGKKSGEENEKITLNLGFQDDTHRSLHGPFSHLIALLRSRLKTLI